MKDHDDVNDGYVSEVDDYYEDDGVDERMGETGDVNHWNPFHPNPIV